MKEKFLNLSKRVGYVKAILSLFPISSVSFFEELSLPEITFKVWVEVYRETILEKLKFLALKKLDGFDVSPSYWLARFQEETTHVWDEKALNGIAKLAIKKIGEAILSFEESTDLYILSRPPYAPSLSDYAQALIGKVLLKKINKCDESFGVWKEKYGYMIHISEPLGTLVINKKNPPSRREGRWEMNSRDWKAVIRYHYFQRQYSTYRDLCLHKLSEFNLSFKEWRGFAFQIERYTNDEERPTKLKTLCVLKMAQMAKTEDEWVSVACSKCVLPALKEMALHKIAETTSDWWEAIYSGASSQDLKDLAFRKMSEWDLSREEWKNRCDHCSKDDPPEVRALFERKMIEKSSTKEELKETFLYYAPTLEIREHLFQRLEKLGLSTDEWIGLYEKMYPSRYFRELIYPNISQANLNFEMICTLCFSSYSDDKLRALGLEKLETYPLTFEEMATALNKSSYNSPEMKLLSKRVSVLIADFDGWISLFEKLDSRYHEIRKLCLVRVSELAQDFNDWKRAYSLKDVQFFSEEESYLLQKMIDLATIVDEWDFIYNHSDEKEKALAALVPLS